MLFIAEKPELARAIVEALGGGKKMRGYYECDNDRVTWCFGHMLELYQPEDYDSGLKKWSLNDLPLFFVPWKKRPVAKSKDQFTVIVGLLREAECVVHAGDPDPEGQLLIDELLEYVDYRGPVKRILINDNNTAVVKKALGSMRDNAEFTGLSKSALARELGDFLYGINMTRLYTLVARREGFDSVLSVGRVQTPILGLVVRRDRQFADPNNRTTYYGVHGVFRAGESRFTASYQVKADDPQDDKGRLSHLPHSQAIADAITGKTAVVKAHDTKPGETPPPLPYNLLKLQIDASRLHGLSPDKVKDITQALREKHRLITYNRSDSQYLSEEQHADAPDVLAAIAANMPDFSSAAVAADPARKSRAFDSSKVTAHHAIIPTQARVDLSALSDDEKKVYRLIARAYLAQFTPPQQWERTTTTLEIEGHTFIRNAKRTTAQGWRELYGSDPRQDADSDGDDDTPETSDIAFAIGQEVACISGQCERKEAGPKPLYTMASLLEDLTRVAQYIGDDTLRKTMVDKDKGKAGERGGIGTPATRDVIIRTLFDRGFIEYSKKGKTQNIVSTKTGQEFYDCLPDNAKFPDMTAVWHSQQVEIESGQRTVDTFVDDLIVYIGNETARVMENGLNLPIEKHACPACSSPMMVKKNAKGKFWGCSRYPDCRVTLFDDNGKPGKPTSGKGEIDPSVLCPACGQPMRLITHPKGDFFGCSNYPNCKTSLKAKDGKPVTEDSRPRISEKHKCKTCGKGLVRRRGKKDGEFFWGCSGFPGCKISYPDSDGKPNYTAKTEASTG